MSGEETIEKYILDTNTLIGFSVWIPIDLNKNFWDKLGESLQRGDWVLLDVVVDEIKYENDGLKKWCDVQKKKGLQKNITDINRNRAVEINNTYKMIDEATGKSTVDVYLIAYAEENKLTVLSRESSRESDTDLYKVPDACRKLNIRSIKRPKEFLQAIGFRN